MSPLQVLAGGRYDSLAATVADIDVPGIGYVSSLLYSKSVTLPSYQMGRWCGASKTPFGRPRGCGRTSKDMRREGSWKECRPGR